ncbi:MAG: TIR domain-containing protein, partial [Caulobacteraceae bacterium]
MSDIFISYARSTAKSAQRIAEALRGMGYGVWRDDELPAHRAYADVIRERLSAAKAVLVLWSADAASSEWVRSEAERARADRKLVQLSLDGAELPMPFDQIQCADMAGWTGDLEAPGWRKVADSIAALAGAGGRSTGGDSSRQRPTPQRAICVLPFANMSGEAEQEYFSDGISEDIITDLSKVSALGVIARNTAFQFKGRSVDVPQVARQLKV